MRVVLSARARVCDVKERALDVRNLTVEICCTWVIAAKQYAHVLIAALIHTLLCDCGSSPSASLGLDSSVPMKPRGERSLEARVRFPMYNVILAIIVSDNAFRILFT